jgi:predicted SAM-dependent methyltransferase
MKLNLGCQVHYFPGWVNVDIVGDDPGIKIDLECDVSKLPYQEESVDFIYAGHLVEHFYPDTLPAAIAEWWRVLRPGGKLVIVTPDCGSVFRDYAIGKLDIEATWQQVYGRIYHYDAPSERHHIAFDRAKLVDMVSPKGWASVESIDFNLLGNMPAELVPFLGVHISNAAYQLGLIMTK